MTGAYGLRYFGGPGWAGGHTHDSLQSRPSPGQHCGSFAELKDWA